MRKNSACRAALITVVLWAVCLRAFAYDPAFPYKDGWMGGDCAYSIPMPDDTRVLWLFGDTYVRNDDVVSRDGSQMVGNTIGLMTWDGVNQKMEYHWNGRNTGAPDAFFQSNAPDWRYWPMDGFTVSNKLYVCLIRVRARNDGALGFENFAVDLAEIPNPQDSPTNWVINIQNLITSTQIFPGVSTVVESNHVYFFTVRDDDPVKQNRPVYLTRLPLSALNNPATNLQYYAKNNTWKTNFVLSDARQIMDHGVTEMTVRWHPSRNKWVLTQIDNGFPARYIWSRTSPSLTGSWSGATTIYTFPEMNKSNPEYDPSRFWYAGKEHIEFATPHDGKTIVTYAGNSFDWTNVIADMDIYVPKPVKVQIDSPTGNNLPIVSITSPTNSAVVGQQSTLQVAVDARDNDGSITNVALYVNGVKAATATNSSCHFDCTNLQPGTNVLMARAWDNKGSMTETAISVTAVPASPTLSASHVGNSIRLNWGVSGFRLQQSSIPESGNWQNIVGSEGATNWIVFAEEPQLFFRLVK